MATKINAIVKNRYKTAAELTAENPILLKGEIGIESDTLKIKIGDEVTTWNLLNYIDTTLDNRVTQNESDISDLQISSYKGIFQVQHQVAPGVASGSVTSGAWRTGPLNTEVFNDISGASLSSNQFTLPAGTYKVLAWRACFYTNAYASRIYNITDSTVAIIGANGYADQGEGYNSEHVPINGIIDIDAPKTFEVQLYPEISRSTDGWGFSTNSYGGLNRVWSDVLIERIVIK